MKDEDLKIRVFVFLPTLNGGGAQRVALRVVSNIDRSRFEPVLVVCNKTGEYVNQLPQDLRVIDLEKPKPKYSILALAQYIRRQKPHVILSYMHNMNTVALLANMFAGNPAHVICGERNAINHLGLSFPFFRKILDRVLIRLSSRILVSSEGMKGSVAHYFKYPLNKINTIYNPVDIKTIQQQASEKVDHPWLDNTIPVVISYGRFVRQKGFDTLIKAFAQVRERQKTKLIILGEGELMQPLRNLVNGLGIEKDVDFPGFQSNPYSFLDKANVFVMSSRWEGMPNSLSEAMAVGVSIVSTTCNYGPAELITNEKEGLLVPVDEPRHMAVAIIRLLNNPNEARFFADRAFQSVQKYNIEFIVRQYENLIASVV